MIERERADMTELTCRPADVASSPSWSRVRSRPRTAPIDGERLRDGELFTLCERAIARSPENCRFGGRHVAKDVVVR